MMKKYKIMIVLSMALLAGACSNTDAPAASPAGAPTAELPSASSSAPDASPAPVGQTLEELIPEQWKMLGDTELGLAKGELDGDGIDDIAVILEAVQAEPGAEPKRALLLALGVGDDRYAESAINESIVYGADEGGVFGDPLVYLGIRDAIVYLEHHGGSNWRWSNSYEIDWRDGGWNASGFSSTSEYLSTPYYEERKYNAYFGDLIIYKVNEDGTEVNETRQLEPETFIPLDQLTRESFEFIYADPLTYDSDSLDFIVTFPETWSQYFHLSEDGPTLDIFFAGESQISEQTPITSEFAAIYWFSIGPLDDSDVDRDMLDGVRKIGEVNGEAYYYYTATDCVVCVLAETDDLGEDDAERALRESDYARYELMNADMESVLLSFTAR